MQPWDFAGTDPIATRRVLCSQSRVRFALSLPRTPRLISHLTLCNPSLKLDPRYLLLRSNQSKARSTTRLKRLRTLSKRSTFPVSPTSSHRQRVRSSDPSTISSRRLSSTTSTHCSEASGYATPALDRWTPSWVVRKVDWEELEVALEHVFGSVTATRSIHWLPGSSKLRAERRKRRIFARPRTIRSSAPPSSVPQSRAHSHAAQGSVQGARMACVTDKSRDLFDVSSMRALSTPQRLPSFFCSENLPTQLASAESVPLEIIAQILEAAGPLPGPPARDFNAATIERDECFAQRA